MTQRGFGAALRRFREQHGFTLRRLGKVTGIAFPYIAALEAGKRGVGPVMATRLADALGLTGSERGKFLLAAQRTSTPLGRNQATSGCPAFLAHLLAEWLRSTLRVDPSHIQEFEYRHVLSVSEATLTSPPHAFIGCLRGANSVPLKPQVREFILSRELEKTLAVVIHPDGGQTVITCEVRTF